jgi:hypothetical protein
MRNRGLVYRAELTEDNLLLISYILRFNFNPQ